MKLAKINHERCNEWDCATYIWIPDEWDKKTFREKVAEARANYLEHRKKFVEMNPPPYVMGWNWEYLATQFPEEFPESMTIGEMKDRLKNLREEKKNYDSEKNKQDRGLTAFLEDLGCVGFYQLDSDENDIINTWLDWGHAHGENYNYEDTKINETYPLERKDDAWT